MAYRLEGATVFLSNVNSGVGAAIGEKLAREGADIVGAYYPQNQVGLDVAKERIGQHRRLLHLVELDQTKYASVQAAIDEAKHVHNGLDMLVTVASRQSHLSFLDMSPEEIQAQVNVNLTGTIFLVHAAAKVMIESRRMEGANPRHRSMVLMGSIRGEVCLKPDPYEAAKAGVHHFARGMSSELGVHGISVNAVAPGTIDSPIEHDRYGKGIDGYRALWGAATPGELATPESVADTVAFLLSSESINGQVLRVDGGYSEKHPLPSQPKA